jgi:hypothetical protein
MVLTKILRMNFRQARSADHRLLWTALLRMSLQRKKHIAYSCTTYLRPEFKLKLENRNYECMNVVLHSILLENQTLFVVSMMIK